MKARGTVSLMTALARGMENLPEPTPQLRSASRFLLMTDLRHGVPSSPSHQDHLKPQPYIICRSNRELTMKARGTVSPIATLVRGMEKTLEPGGRMALLGAASPH